MKRRSAADQVEIPAELAKFDLERWDPGEVPDPPWWQDHGDGLSYRYMLAWREWSAARRLWVRSHPDPDAAIDALHPERHERRIVTAMYGRRPAS